MSLHSDVERAIAEGQRAWDLLRAAMDEHRAACVRFDWARAAETRESVELCWGVFLDAVESGYKRMEVG